MTLTLANQERARELWRDGLSLGDIAEKLGCSAYELSPWLYADEIAAALPKSEGSSVRLGAERSERK